MVIKKCRLLFLFVLTIAILGCSETDIPNTPTEPFNLSRIAITNLSPRTTEIDGTDKILAVGTTVQFNFDVFYTLAPNEAINRNNIVLQILYQAEDENDIFLDSLGPSFVVQEEPLNGNSNSFSISNSINMTDLGVSYTVKLFAIFGDTNTGGFYADNSGELIFDSDSWSAQ